MPNTNWASQCVRNVVLSAGCALLLALSACSDNDQSPSSRLPPQDFGPNAQPGPPMPTPPDSGIGLMGAGQVKSPPSVYTPPANSYAPTTQQ